MTFVCKKHELIKKQFSHDFPYQTAGWEAYDVPNGFPYFLKSFLTNSQIAFIQAI
jgi:hypothetical protein